MKSQRLALILLFFFFGGKTAFTQAWLRDAEMHKKGSLKEQDFYEVRNSFNNYWSGKKITKGKGYKQFRRWENFMEPRVFPDGNLNLPSVWEQSRNNLKINETNGSDWTPIGPVVVPEKASGPSKTGLGRINCIAFHPTNQNILYAGSPSGGLWKTTNGGVSWITTTDDLLSIGISDIAIDPLNPQNIYIATGDGDAGDTYGVGVLKSSDGGTSWNTTNLSLDQSSEVYNRRILINPANPSILLVTSNKGIYRTEDGFSTFSLVKSGNYKDIEFKPGNPNIVYASNYDPRGNARVFKSTDGGKTFSDFSSGLTTNGSVNRIELAVTPANTACVYALCSSAYDDGFYGLYKSLDAGGKWTKMYDDTKKNLLGYTTSGTDAGGQGWYDLAMAVSPVSVNVVYTGGVNIFKSTNGGSLFTINAHWVGTASIDYVHADQHMLAINPLNNFVYSCNDGGVYVSKDEGTSWTDISNGLNILQVYKISASQKTNDFYVTGNQDNGSFRKLDGVWEEINEGDGMECVIDPTNDSIVYTSLYYGSFYRSDDKGETSVYITPENSGDGAWITPFVSSELNPAHIYAGYRDIFKSYNRGNNWFKISRNLAGTSLLRSIAVSGLDENFIYAASYDSIWISKDGGRSWKEISGGLSSRAITTVTLSPYNPLYVWVTLSGYITGEKVYFSENGGDSWINYSDGLPNLPVNTMIYQKNSNQLLYAGTDLGVYYRDKTMSSWAVFNTNLPNVIVNDFEIQYDLKKLVAGTYGRGLWTSPLADASITPLFAEILIPGRYICTGSPITLKASTSAVFDSIVWTFPDDMLSQTKLKNEPVSVSFFTPGTKKIGLGIYYEGKSYHSELAEYVEALSIPSLSIISYDTVNFHKGSLAIISVSGASDFVWDNSPFLNSLSGDLVTANPDKTTTFYVTGSAGSCSARDSITIAVRPSPANDDVCSALQLQTGKNGPFDNFYAGIQINEPLPDTTNCNTQSSWCEQEGGLQASVWFKYTANSSFVSFSSEGFDTQIALYDANTCEDILNGKYTILAANDDYYPDIQFYAAALMKVAVTARKTYFLQLDGSAGGMTGRFYMTVLDNALGNSADPFFNRNVLVFPNPSRGEVTIKIQNAPSEFLYQLFDSQGKKIQEETCKSVTSSNIEKKISLTGKGIYLIRISANGLNYTTRVLNLE
jgi:photosystem II stability/assembly factor-like uncharacterized protein